MMTKQFVIFDKDDNEVSWSDPYFNHGDIDGHDGTQAATLGRAYWYVEPIQDILRRADGRGEYRVCDCIHVANSVESK